MYPICINPFINRNIFDNYVECISIIGQQNRNKYYIEVNKSGFKVPYVAFNYFHLQDFIGNIVNVNCRVAILSYMIGSLSDEEFEKEYEESYNKFILKKEELYKIRDAYSDKMRDFNLVDLVYSNSDNFDKAKLMEDYDSILGNIAFGGYDLVYFYADLSKEDMKKETEDVIDNRTLCFDLLDEVRKEAVGHGTGTKNI